MGCSLIASTLCVDSALAQGLYCTPSFSNGCYDGDMIDDFTIPTAGFSHLGTGCSLDGSYTDYSSVSGLSITLAKGINIDFIITSGYDMGKMMIWIDTNNNGIFESTEAITNDSDPIMTGPWGDVSYTKSLFIPTTTVVGSYRMRVGYRYYSNPEPCGSTESYQYGEFHDYTVNVVNPPCTPATYTHTVVDDCDENTFSVNFNFTDLGDADSIIIRY